MFWSVGCFGKYKLNKFAFRGKLNRLFPPSLVSVDWRRGLKSVGQELCGVWPVAWGHGPGRHLAKEQVERAGEMHF